MIFIIVLVIAIALGVLSGLFLEKFDNGALFIFLHIIIPPTLYFLIEFKIITNIIVSIKCRHTSFNKSIITYHIINTAT